MASIYENRFRRMAEMAGSDGQAGSVPVLTTQSGPELEVHGGSDGPIEDLVMIVGNLLGFDLRPQLIRREDYVVLERSGK